MHIRHRYVEPGVHFVLRFIIDACDQGYGRARMERVIE